MRFIVCLDTVLLKITRHSNNWAQIPNFAFNHITWIRLAATPSFMSRRFLHLRFKMHKWKIIICELHRINLITPNMWATELAVFDIMAYHRDRLIYSYIVTCLISCLALKDRQNQSQS